MINLHSNPDIEKGEDATNVVETTITGHSQYGLLSRLGCHAKEKQSTALIWKVASLVLLVLLLLSVLPEHKPQKPVAPAQTHTPNNSFQAEVQRIYDKRNPREEPHYALRDAWCYLQPEKFESLSAEDRFFFAEIIALFEADQLGIPAVNVATDTQDTNMLACYWHQNRTILVSPSLLKYSDPFFLVSTLAHEAFHAYQYYCVEYTDFSLPVVQNTPYFHELRDWKENIENYRSVYDGYSHAQYALQSIEKSAEAYGYKEAEQIFSHMYHSELND